MGILTKAIWHLLQELGHGIIAVDGRVPFWLVFGDRSLSFPEAHRVNRSRCSSLAPGCTQIVLLLLSLFCVRAPLLGDEVAGSLAPTEKLPAPAAGALQESIKTVRSAYGQKIDSAPNAEAKQAACRELIKSAADETDPINRFALLSVARDTAVSGGELPAAFEAIDSLDHFYRIDVVRMKFDAAHSAAKLLNSTPARANFIKAVLRLLDQAVAADRYEYDHDLGNLATNAAHDANNPSLGQKATDAVRRANSAAAAFNEAKRSMAILDHDPENSEANLKVGKYRCLIKGDWQGGLPMLAKGSDPTLKDLARDDLANPSDADRQMKTADRWWALAEKEKTDSRSEYQHRAAKWYEAAAPQLSGLRLLSLKKRLAEVQAADQVNWRELIKGMSASKARFEGGSIVIHEPGSMVSQETFTPPVTFRITVQTDSKDIRIKYACEQIIFNWNGNPDELRLDGGPADGRHKAGAGRVPVNKWVTIELEVLPGSLSLSVDGEPRYRTEADFSKVLMPFTIWPSERSTMRLKSILVREP